MKLDRIRERLKIVVLGVCAVAAVFFSASVNGTPQVAECSSGKLSAKLTGWVIENKMPSGKAEYSLSDKSALMVSVDSVNLPDGTTLAVYDGDDHLGDLPGLKGGVSTATLATSKALSEGALIRVMKEDVWVLSGDQTCSKEQPK